MASNPTQTVPLDAYPDTPLDQFPDVLHRQVVAEVGLDGLNDAMELEIDGVAFADQSRAVGSEFSHHDRGAVATYEERSRDAAIWTKLA